VRTGPDHGDGRRGQGLRAPQDEQNRGRLVDLAEERRVVRVGKGEDAKAPRFGPTDLISSPGFVSAPVDGAGDLATDAGHRLQFGGRGAQGALGCAEGGNEAGDVDRSYAGYRQEDEGGKSLVGQGSGRGKVDGPAFAHEVVEVAKERVQPEARGRGDRKAGVPRDL
jgi:hypothetical protein